VLILSILSYFKNVLKKKDFSFEAILNEKLPVILHGQKEEN
jgi:hypothetical protein